MGSTTFDVALVGGGVAGCSAAIRFSQMGHRVAVFEKQAVDDERYKRLCTHFIQPSATPLLTPLGLTDLYESKFSIRTKARFTTPGGVISTPGGYADDGPHTHALNLERRVLDPALRDAAQRAGVELIDAAGVERLERDPAGGWSLEAKDGHGGTRSFDAKLVVAADGRRSRLAGQLENPTASHANDRAARFGYFTGIEAPPDNHSLFILHEREMVFLYPLIDGRTLLSVYVEKPRLAEWLRSGDPMGEFLRFCAATPDMPSLAGAEPETTLLGYADYPSLIRQAVWNGVPFIGDAGMSLDPMSGVGCSFALQSADLLATAFTGRSLEGADIEEGLEVYRRRHEEEILPHAAGICADSLVGKNAAAQMRVFRTISENAELSQKYLGLTGRIVLPADFQRALMRAMLPRRAPKAEEPRSSPSAAAVTAVGSNADR